MKSTMHAGIGSLIAILCLAGLPLDQARAQTLHLAANENAVEQVVASHLIREIYARAGLGVEIEPLPGRRANHAAVTGAKDGEVARIAPYAAENPPLLRVDPPYYRLTTGVFTSSRSRLTIRSKEDLAGLRVGVVRGIAHAERAASGLANVTVVDKYEQLYRMIDAGRIDVGIDTGINGKAEIRRLGLAGSVRHAGDIATFDLHNILVPARADLAARIAAAIRAMQRSGELRRLTDRYEKLTIETIPVEP